MATSGPKSNLNLKLLVNTKTQKLLFAEADKDFVDFLFTLLALPVGAVVRLLSQYGMVGALDKLYDSVENLSQDYFQTNIDKNALLNPMAPSGGAVRHIFMLSQDQAQSSTMGNNGRSSAVYGSSYCSCVYPCNCYRSRSPPTEQGYVKGLVTYMVMDDLEVKPLSTISSIAMLTNAKDVEALKEMKISVGMVEGLKLLKASFQTENVLSQVFLGN